MTDTQHQPDPNLDPAPATPSVTQQVSHVLLAKYDDYAAVQAVVDMLSDKGFDVSALDIVGHGLHSVESVKGRMTKGKAAGLGAAGGAWWGLLLGILFTIFVPVGWLMTLLIAIVLGALWGALFGFLGHSATGGKRDFTSVKTLESTSYDLMVKRSHADEAKRIIAQGR